MRLGVVCWAAVDERCAAATACYPDVSWGWDCASYRLEQGSRQPVSAPRFGACKDEPGGDLQDRIDDCPGGFNRVLTREERSIANHGIAQEPLIRSSSPGFSSRGRALVVLR